MSDKRIAAVRKIATAVSALLLVAVCVFAQSKSRTPVMMTTIEGGHEIVLNPDSTWGFTKAGLLDGDLEDEYQEIRHQGVNKTLWIRPDYTWGFTTQPLKPRWPKEFPAVSASATSTSPAMNVADESAKRDVYNKAAAAMQKNVPIAETKKKDMPGYLQACLKDEIKENEIEISYGQLANKSWKADAKISIPGHRVKKIMSCLEYQLTPAPAEAAK